MKYGLIGERLGHSFSKEVHAMLSDYDYEIREIERDELDSFMLAADFKAINVTIPYKESVMPYLSFISEEAKMIGSVNTIVKRDGALYGYNTDFFGLKALIDKMRLNITGKKTIILGTGGTAKTALAVAKSLGAGPILTVSRTAKEGAISYESLKEHFNDARILINTTPVGMYPDNDSSPVKLSDFTALEGVIDAVYNPLRTNLVIEASERGIKAEGGLYMLVAQAVFASEIFFDVVYPIEKLNKIYNKIKRKKENIVLIGMPASGKSTVSKILADQLSRESLDTDAMVEETSNMKIQEIFESAGESAFRELESNEIKKASLQNSKIIATGGGAILDEKNVRMLKQNGKLFFIDRPCDKLLPTADRPLADSREAIAKRYEERYELYLKSADVVIDADDTPHSISSKITGAFYK